MPPKEINKSRNWGQADKDHLAELINTQQIDITDISYQNIEQVRDLHFRHRSKHNFRRNFRDYSAAWDLEIEYSGARRRKGGKMLRFSLIFLPLFASTYAFPSPLPRRQFQTKRKSPTTKAKTSTTPTPTTTTPTPTPPSTTLPPKTPTTPPCRPGS
jgi:hypothetical protein